MAKDREVGNEFSFIRQASDMFASFHQGVTVPSGDDAAVVKFRPGMGSIVCVDTVVEDIHFKRSTMSPYQIGYKSVAINLSDIAAMGGEPKYFLVSIAVPAGWREEELLEIYAGMKELADAWEMDLVGGDTVSSKSGLVVSVTMIGEVESHVRLLRSNARPGDRVFITGNIGDSAAGLDCLLARNQHGLDWADASTKGCCPPLIDAHQRPSPHLRQGRILAQFAQNYSISLNDVSDGIASEANEIAAASHVDIVIEKERLPLSVALRSYAESKNKDPYDWALHGGEDFVLIGTLPPEIIIDVEYQFAKNGLPFHLIGQVLEGAPLVRLYEQGREVRLEAKGYNHFNTHQK